MQNTLKYTLLSTLKYTLKQTWDILYSLKLHKTGVKKLVVKQLKLHNLSSCSVLSALRFLCIVKGWGAF